MNTTTTNTATNASASAPLSFAQIETACKQGRVTLDMIASSNGWTKANARKALISHFGTRITFARGRAGGIRIV
jgi:hypothetical protein